MSFLEEPLKVKARTVSLDAYCKSNNAWPDFIKIDAEGAEHLILKAMTDLLKEKKPIVTIEVAGGEEWKDNCALSIGILEENGYICHEIDLDGYLRPHIKKDSYEYDNLLFAHPENIGRLKPLIKA